jgi:hypothetical protein
MPEISRFFGIVITMYAKDHVPPHFHARYGDEQALFSIENGEVIEGSISRRALRLIQDWTELHRDELFFNYQESQKETPNFKKIAPLK